MAATPVEVIHGITGLTSCTLKLFPLGVDTLANGSGDTLTEQTNRKGVYRATVDEDLTGRHEAYMVNADGVVLYTGVVDLADTTDVFTVRELSASDVVLSAGDIEDIVAGIAAEGALLVQYSIDVSTDDIDTPTSAGLTTGYFLCLGIDGQPEAGVTIVAEMVSGPGTAGFALDRGAVTMTSDAEGIAQHAGFIQGASYRFKRGTDQWWGKILTAPATTTWAIGELLGKP